MTISIKQVKELRDRTNISLGECTKALNETGGDVDAAIEVLKKRGAIRAAKKAGRVAANGQLYSYIHFGGKIAVLAEINCETDFAAKSDEFKSFCETVALQIASMNPTWLCREDMEKGDINQQKLIFHEQMPKKTKNDYDKIIAGKMNKWYSEVCLLDQESVLHPKQTIDQLRVELSNKIGEKVEIRRFVRWELGDGIEKEDKDYVAEIETLSGVKDNPPELDGGLMCRYMAQFPK